MSDFEKLKDELETQRLEDIIFHKNRRNQMSRKNKIKYLQKKVAKYKDMSEYFYNSYMQTLYELKEKNNQEV